MKQKIDLWSHRLYMIMVLPIVLALAFLIGPLIGLGIVYDKFKEHW